MHNFDEWMYRNAESRIKFEDDEEEISIEEVQAEIANFLAKEGQ